MGKRRTFTKEFKLDVLRELENTSAAEVCRQHDISAVLLNRWKKEYETSPKEAFSGRGKIWKEDAKIVHYERLVGQLYAEIDFLKKTLEKMQELRAEEKRNKRLTK